MGRYDYSNSTNIKTANQKKKDATILADIEKINLAIESSEEDDLRALHISLDGKYSSYIPNWGMSTYGYNEQFGFDYRIGKKSLEHNLSMFKARLEGFLCGFDFPIVTQSPASMNNINVDINNSNEIAINITFKEAKQKIEEMPGLNETDTEEIKSKIDDLESISQEKISKKKKWEKVKPILAFALDKGADVAITIMGLILQMGLGM